MPYAAKPMRRLPPSQAAAPAPAVGDAGPATALTNAAIAKLFVVSALIYMTFYTIEAPIRYVLYLMGKDSMIFVRDGLIFGPLAILFGAQALRLKLHPAFLVAGALFTFHGLVFIGTIGVVIGVVYGIKILINILFGFFIASMLIHPSTKTMKFFAAVWGITVLGAFLDKFFQFFPWTGITTIVGDISVDVSRDWQIQDSFQRRVAGFTRSSIAIAAMLPLVSIVLINHIKRIPLRFVFAVISIATVFLTTQKGSLIAFAPIIMLMCLPSVQQYKWMKVLCVTFLSLAVALPVMTWSLNLDHGSGVFSVESLQMRIETTWPMALDWINRHEMLLFGVGIGGISGAQRLYAPEAFNAADNMIIFLYAYFGAFTALYIGLVMALVFRPVRVSIERVTPAIAIIAFAFGYGTVLSIVEDQSAALFLGAAIGVLCQETVSRKPARKTTWEPSQPKPSPPKSPHRPVPALGRSRVGSHA